MEKNNKVLDAMEMYKCIGCLSCMLACARIVYNDYSLAKSAIRIRSEGGLQGRFVADICRGCKTPACAEICNARALIPRNGGGVIFYKDKCNGCGRCIKACPIEAIHFDEKRKKPIICIQCGVCVKNCPHQVLSMEVKNYDQYRFY